MVNPLARAMMGGSGKAYSSTSYDKERDLNNITDRDKELLKNIMNKDIKVNGAGGKGNMITLDEVAKRIKNGPK